MTTTVERDENGLVVTPPRITWWVYAGSERIPRTAMMRGWWGYDATCSCGWDSRTGGATERYVRLEVWHHKKIDHVEGKTDS